MHYRLIFDGIWLILVVYWVASAFGNKRAVYRTNQGWRFLALLLVLALVWMFFAFPQAFGRRILPFSDAAAWAGIVICAGGAAFAIWARRTLGTNWSGNPSIKEGHELIEAGPYRFVRHPIYTGILAALLGTFIAGGRVRELVVLVASVILLSLKLGVEEALMMRQFPAAYPEYRKRTKALIPFIL